MKRFVTYLYEYEGGQKTKNAGFVRVDIRGTQLGLQLCMRNNSRGNDLGAVFILVKSNALEGVKIGDVRMNGNQTDVRFTLQTDNIMESSFSFKDVVGIGIRYGNNGYLASCWKDEDAEKIGEGEFNIYQKEVEPVMQVAEIKKEDAMDDSFASSPKEQIKYRKIEVSQLRELPSSNWHLCNNSFLLHGAFNYGYLIIKEVVYGGKKTLWLGVPGFFEKPEMVMAVFFGFPEFEPIPRMVADMEIGVESENFEIEKNQEPKTGIFGGWFVKLNE